MSEIQKTPWDKAKAHAWCRDALLEERNVSGWLVVRTKDGDVNAVSDDDIPSLARMTTGGFSVYANIPSRFAGVVPVEVLMAMTSMFIDGRVAGGAK